MRFRRSCGFWQNFVLFLFLSFILTSLPRFLLNYQPLLLTEVLCVSPPHQVVSYWKGPQVVLLSWQPIRGVSQLDGRIIWEQSRERERDGGGWFSTLLRRCWLCCLLYAESITRQWTTERAAPSPPKSLLGKRNRASIPDCLDLKAPRVSPQLWTTTYFIHSWIYSSWARAPVL